MITLALVLATMMQQAPAGAEAPAPSPTEAPSPTTAVPSEADFAAALAADQKAAQEAAAVTAPVPAPGPGVASQALLNPETSVIITSSAGLGRREDAPPVFTAGDDAPVDDATLQEVEITFAADVDPYFKARLFLAIPHLEGVEVEEGYMISSSLPWNLQLKVGLFRSAFGRNNEQHLHVQDFARRPLTTSALGEDGLRPPGGQLSLLVPLPWYTVVWAEGFTLTPRKASTAFGLDQFFELGDAWSLLLGLSGASLASGPEAEGTPEMPVLPPGRRTLAGGDLYLKWRPINETQTYAWVALTAEYIAEREDDPVHDHWGGVGYAQLVAQVARRWRLGARFDFDGTPSTEERPRAWVTSASIAFLPTEFSRVRFTYQHQSVKDNSAQNNDFFFLQLEGAIGAHGAHPF